MSTTLDNDVLLTILTNLTDPNDRTSFSQTCKQFLTVEGLTRTSIRVFEPESIPNFLTRFPNLLTFKSSATISDEILNFVAKSCPNLVTLNLKISRNWDESEFIFDFGNNGVVELAKGCPNLAKFLVRRRKVGDFGVCGVVEFARNLTVLDLGWCKGVGDRSLEAIGKLGLIRVLNLEGCSLVSDKGVEFLANGVAAVSLRKLVLAECDRITDRGLYELSRIRDLEELSLAECGAGVTNVGIIWISLMSELRKLDFSWLVNLSGNGLFNIGCRCFNLVEICLTGCESIMGFGIRELAGLPKLEVLVLKSCFDIVGTDVEFVVMGCRSLRYVVLDKGLKQWILPDIQNNIARFCQLEFR